MTLSKTLWRRVVPLLALVAAVSSTSVGCGRGGYYAPLSGTLEVRNSPSSFFGIDVVEISTPFGPVDHYDVFLAPGESWSVDLRPDSYDVDLYWSDGSTDSFVNFDINDGDHRVITGHNP